MTPMDELNMEDLRPEVQAVMEKIFAALEEDGAIPLDLVAEATEVGIEISEDAATCNINIFMED